jgi:hypothetical protein
MKRLISEDQKIYDVQRQQQGIKNQYDPQLNKVDTLVKQNNKDNHLAPRIKPYPLDLHDQILSNMYIDMMNYNKMLLNGIDTIQGMNKPELQQMIPVLREIEKKIKHINEVLVEVDGLMTKIS